MTTCKGKKLDGTPCQSPIVMPNGYCARHQDQAHEEPAPSPAREPLPATTCEACGDLWCMLFCIAGAMALVLCLVAILRRIGRALQD